MSYANEKLTEKQLNILKVLGELDKGNYVRPSEMGRKFNMTTRRSGKFICSGLIWLIHYGLAVRCGRGRYRITAQGIYYLQHFC